jgi:hypothetical protein
MTEALLIKYVPRQSSGTLFLTISVCVSYDKVSRGEIFDHLCCQ